MNTGSTSNDAAPAAPGPARSIDSRAGFQDCLRAAFDEAAAAGCRELWLADADFSRWPLGEVAVVASLARWAQLPDRRFHLLASSFDAIERYHPRWVAWRRQWAHRVDCRANTELEPGRLPTLLIAPGAYSLRLHDPGRCRGRFSRDLADAQRCREEFDAALQQSHPAFAPTVTGL